MSPPPGRPDSPKRRLLLAGAGVGLALFGWLSIEVWRSKQDPEGYRAWNGPGGWILGPPAAELTDAAHERIEAGLEQLNDVSLEPTTRVELYREQLKRAEALLVRSLRAQPAQAGALASLAAVRWELDPPLDAEARQRHLGMIALAARMAPTYPEVQRRLGELLLRMGRPDDAASYLRRTLELEPLQAREVVELLLANLFTADEIAAALPAHPLVLSELERPFFAEARDRDYLDLVQRAIERAGQGVHPALLVRYGNTCLRLGIPERLVERLDALGELPEAPAEAERLFQRARGYLALHEPERALEDAVRARTLEPDAPYRAEQLGDVALAARRGAAAVDALQHALRVLARAKAPPVVRARLYRKIGQAEELRSRPDLAYDAYKRALALAPAEAHASARVRAMERAAGFD